jgi:arylsulfatase A-like enzyme
MTQKTHSNYARLSGWGLTLLSMLCAMFFSINATSAKHGRKPNVLFIITDDQELDSFGFIGKKALTPHIDRLAREGVFFSRGYVSSSVCTPSRYSCMTGRYASRSQVTKFTKNITSEGQTWVHWNADLAQSETNIAKLLQKNGYVTGIVGKLHGFELPGHHKSINRRADANDPQVIATLQQDQTLFAQELKQHGFDYAAHLHRGNLGSGRSIPLPLCQHAPEWTAQAALEFITQNKDRPFYLYYATTLLHGPHPLTSLRADPRISEAGFLKEPPDVQPSRASVLQRIKQAGVEEKHAPAAWHDDNIGALLNKLDELGIADNTLVIYFNDHGVEGGKGTLYEGGVHTPIIMRYPGTIKPGHCDALVQNVDFVPTILSACGIAPPTSMPIDGVNVMSLLTGASDTRRDSLYCEIGYTRAVVTPRYKYLAFRVPPSRQISPEANLKAMREAAEKAPAKKGGLEINPEGRITHIHRFPGGDGTELGNGLKHYRKNYFDTDQLYDLEKDPEEKTNLADDPSYRGVLKEMQAKLSQHLEGVPGPFAEFKNKL